MAIPKLWGVKDGKRGFAFSHVLTTYYNFKNKVLLKTKLDEMDTAIAGNTSSISTVDKKFANYLPLTGGKVKGNITVENSSGENGVILGTDGTVELKSTDTESSPIRGRINFIDNVFRFENDSGNALPVEGDCDEYSSDDCFVTKKYAEQQYKNSVILSEIYHTSKTQNSADFVLVSGQTVNRTSGCLLVFANVTIDMQYWADTENTYTMMIDFSVGNDTKRPVAASAHVEVSSKAHIILPVVFSTKLTSNGSKVYISLYIVGDPGLNFGYDVDYTQIWFSPNISNVES